MTPGRHPHHPASQPDKILRLGTRGSDLALTQSGTIAEQLAAIGQATRLKIIRTSGDRSQAASFGAIGPQGVFVRELEQALLDGVIDLAVHSFKDLPTISPAGLAIGAVPVRADPADVLLVREDRLDPEKGWLPVFPNAKIGTSSVRRAVWLTHFRQDLEVAALRGNVPTRVGKLRDGHYDAIVLAAAGVARLKDGGNSLDELLEDIVAIPLDPRRFVPAPAQGALAVQCRSEDTGLLALLEQLDDAPSRIAVTIERAALERAEAGCNTAFGAYCVPGDSTFELIAMLERDGRVLSASVRDDTPERTLDNLWDLIGAGS